MAAFISRELRHAIRHLWRSPSFCVAAIATLALSIGATSAMFSLQNALVIRKLPVPDPNSLIAISGRSPQDQLRLTPIPVLDELSKDGNPFREICGYNSGVVLAVGAGNETSQAIGALVTGRCFETIGVPPLLGRSITDDDAPLYRQGSMVAVISHRLWMRLFGGDPAAIGKSIRVEGAELAVIGVMPKGFDGIDVDAGVDIFAPFDTMFPARADRRPGAAFVLGRLRPEVSFESMSQQIAAGWPALLQAIVPAAVPGAERASLLSARPKIERMATGISGLRVRYGRPVAIMLGLSAILLVLACINLGGLLLSRAIDRAPEMAMRLALGSSYWQIVRQMLIENVLISTVGAALAIPLAFAIANGVASFLPPGNIARTLSVTPDSFVIALTMAAGIGAGLVMGILPIAVALPRREALALAWHRTVARSSLNWVRGLLIAQVALSLVMIVGAGLLGRSLRNLQQVDPGIDVDGLLMVRLHPLPNGYANIDNASYYPALLDRVRAIPGVQSVALGRAFPRMFTDAGGQSIAIVGEEQKDLSAFLEITSPDYFSTLGIALVDGRTTSWQDNDKTRHVVVVNERLARLLREDGRVIGRRLKFGTDPLNQDVEVVGVVRNATMGNPRSPDVPVFFRPALQVARYANYGALLIRTNDRAPGSVVPATRRIIAEAGHEFVPQVSTVEDVLYRAPASERMSATLAATLGVLAVVLAFIGVFAVLAYSVARRTREMGVRTAIGATPRQVIRLVLREGVALTAAGVALGLPIAYFSSRLLRGLLFGVPQSDPVTFTVTALFLVGIGVAAGLVPARRAAGVDPVIALRTE
jgi:putative ABC transport system permease protein